MRILICDDEIQYANDLKKHVEEYMNNHYVNYRVDTVDDPLVVKNSDLIYDLAFLDIQMEGLNGFSLAKELKTRNGKLIVFFITSFNEYQDTAMDAHAFRFFEKPFDAGRLYSGLDKAMEYIDESYVDLFLYQDKAQKRILVDNIMFVERANRQVKVFTKDKIYITRETFDELCALLPNSFFYLVHKSYLVNLHYVNSYNYKELLLLDDTRIPISSRRQAEFHKYWFIYLRRR